MKNTEEKVAIIFLSMVLAYGVCLMGWITTNIAITEINSFKEKERIELEEKKFDLQHKECPQKAAHAADSIYKEMIGENERIANENTQKIR